MESFKRKFSGFFQKWPGLPLSLTSGTLYRTINTMQLPFSGLTQEFKVAHTREALLYRDSRDLTMYSVVIKGRTSRRWKAETAVEVAEPRLRQKALAGLLATAPPDSPRLAAAGLSGKTVDVSPAHCNNIPLAR